MAGSRTITTTDAREAELDLYLVEENARRAAQSPPLGAITKNQLVQGMNNQVIDSWIKSRAEREEAANLPALRDAYLAATPAARTAARAAIGLP